MKTVETILRQEMQQLKKMLMRAKERMKTAPEGHLRVRSWNGVVEYYYKGKQEGGNGKYVKKSEIGFIRKLVQRDYDIRMMKCAEERIKEIDKFLSKYESLNIKGLYQSMNLHRRELLYDAVMSDEEYVKFWQMVEYEGKTFEADMPEIFTDRGECVRSKSEKLIADKLNALGIPYRYEYPLVLEGNIKLYPDFTILKMPEREEVYLEHLGLLDDENYLDTTLFKLNTYERNEIYLGVNLFITYETKRFPLNTRALDRLIKKLFCDF